MECLLTKEEIKKIFINNGFKIYEGLTDLKPYVYDAAYALLEAQKQKESELYVKIVPVY